MEELTQLLAQIPVDWDKVNRLIDQEKVKKIKITLFGDNGLSTEQLNYYRDTLGVEFIKDGGSN